MKWHFSLIFLLVTSSIIVGSKTVDNEVVRSKKYIDTGKCTTEILAKKVQCFSDVPKPAYEVVEGSNLTLSCSVRNRHGQVQWRMAGFDLGYDPRIPGFPRYQMSTLAEKGEYFLKINNVKRNDSGVYECRVQPSGSRHPMLHYSTNVTVWVRPESPKVFLKTDANQRSIAVIRVRQQQSVFVCSVKEGIPDVKFQWFLNDKALKSTGTTTSAIRIQLVNTFTSELTTPITILANNDKVKCRISSKLPNLNNDSKKEIFENTIELNLEEAPGQPTIVSITNSIDGAYNEGDIIKSNCESRPPGIPLSSISWIWQLPSTVSSSGSKWRKILPELQTQFIKHNKIWSRLQLKPLTRNLHGYRLVCMVQNPSMTQKIVARELLINYPPTKAALSVNDGGYMKHIYLINKNISDTVLTGKIEDEMTITCTTEDYYKKADIKWHITLANETNQSSSNKTFFPIINVWKTGLSYRQNSTIKVILKKELIGGFINCFVESGEGQIQVRAKFEIEVSEEGTGFNLRFSKRDYLFIFVGVIFLIFVSSGLCYIFCVIRKHHSYDVSNKSNNTPDITITEPSVRELSLD